jgi:hypothetical protein
MTDTIKTEIEKVEGYVANILTLYDDIENDQPDLYECLAKCDFENFDTENMGNSSISFDELKSKKDEKVKEREQQVFTGDVNYYAKQVYILEGLQNEVRVKINKTINLIIVDLIEYIFKNPGQAEKAKEHFRDLQKYIL